MISTRICSVHYCSLAKLSCLVACETICLNNMAGEGGFAKQHLLTGRNAFYFDGEVFLSEIYGLVLSYAVKPT